jgi:hypothetical protein
MDIQEIAAKLLEQETSDEMKELKMRILERIATETDIKPARIPAPLNITEIGGYYNLLKEHEELQLRMLESVLGLPYSSKE